MSVDQTVTPKRAVSDESLAHSIKTLDLGYTEIPLSTWPVKWIRKPLEDGTRRLLMEIVTEGIAERGGSFVHDGMRFTVVGGKLVRSMR